MSENLDLARSIYADWERGDFTSAEWADPDIEWVMTGGPAPGSRTGVAGMAEGFRDFLSAWDWYRMEVDEYRELDDRRVLVLIRCIARGKTSGLDIAQIRTESATVFHLRDGKVVRLLVYMDRDRALADLGLAPEGDTPSTSDRP
jgi:ketosteroid isomerase-like protein